MPTRHDESRRDVWTRVEDQRRRGRHSCRSSTRKRLPKSSGDEAEDSGQAKRALPCPQAEGDRGAQARMRRSKPCASPVPRRKAAAQGRACCRGRGRSRLPRRGLPQSAEPKLRRRCQCRAGSPGRTCAPAGAPKSEPVGVVLAARRCAPQGRLVAAQELLLIESIGRRTSAGRPAPIGQGRSGHAVPALWRRRPAARTPHKCLNDWGNRAPSAMRRRVLFQQGRCAKMDQT